MGERVGHGRARARVPSACSNRQLVPSRRSGRRGRRSWPGQGDRRGNTRNGVRPVFKTAERFSKTGRHDARLEDGALTGSEGRNQVSED